MYFLISPALLLMVLQSLSSKQSTSTHLSDKVFELGVVVI
jgi:hypothetical protein